MRGRAGFGKFRGRSRNSVKASLLAFVLTVGLVVAVSPARADVTTVSADTYRTGWDPNEAALSPSAVAGSDFGQLFSTALTGQVYAQPLVVGSTVIVATEENYVYGLDSETGAVLWSRHLGPAWPVSTVGCGDLVPDIGVTSTPVYNPADGYLYLTSKVNDGASAATPHYYLHALSAGSGAERPGWPVTIQGSPGNDPSNAFDPEDAMQRPGLLLQNGAVYLGFGSHCDHQPYRGYVVGVDIGTKALHMWTTEVGTSGEMAGIWQAGGGIVSDGTNGMFVATGNGVAPPVGPGTSPPATLSESVVHLKVASDGTLSASDFFAPANADTLDANDEDLGSGGPVALPEAQFGTAQYPHLLTEIGKDGRLFLLNRDNLGGRGQGTGGSDQVVAMTNLSGVWGHPAVWGGDGGYVYVDESGKNLVALQYGLSAGTPALSTVGSSAETFGYTSGSPVVTSNGTTSGSAVVWAVQSSGADGTNGRLMAYQAVPTQGVMTPIRSFALGTVSKFSVPATNHGRVYVGTRDGNLIAFGAPTTQALKGSPVAFGSYAVGSTGSATATLTATRTVTVSAISAAAPFGATPPKLPVTLTSGQAINVPVTFSPAAPGAVNGDLVLTTDAGTIHLALSGTGTQPGFSANPTTLTWDTMPVGSSKTMAVTVTNTSTGSESFSAVTGPSAPFTAGGLPKVGDTLAPGASTSLSVTYAPTAAGNDSSSIVLASGQGSVTIPLSGTAIVAHPEVTITPQSLSFGTVPVGQTATQSFTVKNTGNVVLTVTKGAPPAGPFGVTNPIPEGQQLAPGEGYTVSVTFTPTAPADFSGVYQITTDTGQGPTNVTLSGTGGGTGGVVNGGFESGDLTGWSTTGSASVVSSGAHSGTYALQLGNPTATTGDSTATQTFLAPSSTSTLSLWYNVSCPDAVNYDWATVTLTDNTTSTTTTILPKTCNSGAGWTNVSGSVTPGHSYTLTLVAHDDGDPEDPTYAQYDDVTLG